MTTHKLRRTYMTSILFAALPTMLVYVMILYGNTQEPTRHDKLETTRQSTMTEHPVNKLTNMSSNKNVAFTSAAMAVSKKAVIANNVSSNNVTLDIQLPYPRYKPHERRNVDVNIDRVYGCGLKSMNVVRPKEERIPRIIHFMWTTEIIPSLFVDNLKSFVAHNPTWTYYLWTAVSAKRFISDKYPALLQTFKGYSHNMSRYDAARYAIIHFYGGAYFDLDTTCIKPLDPLLETEECIVTPEPMEHAVTVLNIRSVLGNCVFLCKPRHGFLAHVLTELDGTKSIINLMQSAGPIFFTTAFRTYITSCLKGKAPANESIHVMSGEYFLDYVKDDVHENLKKQCENLNSKKSGIGYLIEACVIWSSRGAEHRTLSNKAYSMHFYFSSYMYDNYKKLDQLPENNIKNIIPKVKLYPD